MNTVPPTADEMTFARNIHTLQATVSVDRARAERVAERYKARMKRLSRRKRKEEKRRIGFKLLACITVSLPFKYSPERYAKD